MLADYFTKPLQGKQFRIFRDQILNFQDASLAGPTNVTLKDHRSVLELGSDTGIKTSTRPSSPNIPERLSGGNGTSKEVKVKTTRIVEQQNHN